MRNLRSSAGVIANIYLLFCLIFSASVFAQAPQGINYQAIARNTAGQPVLSKTINVRISITDGTGGPLVYREVHNPTTNQFGLFTLKIGGGTADSGTFSALSWGTLTAWMEVELDITNTSNYTFMGSSQLLSVPYALFAASGNPGPQGAQGPQGPQGLAGAQGSQGPAGPVGADGQTGTQGPQGLQGPIGLTGSQGPQGIQGAQGIQGIQGLQGIQGPQGTAGFDGDRYTTTSVSSLNISNGTKNLTVDTALSYAVGQTVIIANSATDQMTGTVLSYNSSTGALSVSVTSFSGNGTFTSWNVALNGAAGPAGPQGSQGIQGLTGVAGTNGSTWFTGSGVPSGATGVINDLYLNKTNGDYYVKTGASAWTLLANLTGPQGLQGIQGIQGSTGAQGPQGITGATGVQGPVGPAGPQGSTGPQGQQGIQGPQGAIGPQGPSGSNGTNGATWRSGTGVPSSALGVAGDYYINNLNGDYYLKTSSTVWTMVSSLKGPKGDSGAANINGVKNYLIRFNSATTGVNSKVYDNGVNVGVGTNNPQAQLDVSGYTRLGVESPNLSMKKLTGTTASSEGGSVTIAHGLTSIKILSVTVTVENATGTLTPPGFTESPGLQYNFQVDPTNVTIFNSAANSSNILSKNIRVLLTYEQ